MVAGAGPYRIVYKANALSDIQEIRDYIAKDSPEAGDRYARFLIESVMSLSDSPASFRVYETGLILN